MKVVLFCGGYGMRMRNGAADDLPKPKSRVGPRPLMWHGNSVLRPEFFDQLPENGDLMEDACDSLAKQGKLMAYPYRGFWHPADTIKERNLLEAAYQSGTRPWMVWEQHPDRDPFQGLIARERELER